MFYFSFLLAFRYLPKSDSQEGCASNGPWVLLLFYPSTFCSSVLSSVVSVPRTSPLSIIPSTAIYVGQGRRYEPFLLSRRRGCSAVRWTHLRAPVISVGSGGIVSRSGGDWDCLLDVMGIKG